MYFIAQSSYVTNGAILVCTVLEAAQSGTGAVMVAPLLSSNEFIPPA